MVLMIFALLGVGCSVVPNGPTHVSDVGINVRADVEILDPATGERLGWPEFMARVDGVDVVLLGEQHDHACAGKGHAPTLRNWHKTVHPRKELNDDVDRRHQRQGHEQTAEEGANQGAHHGLGECTPSADHAAFFWPLARYAAAPCRTPRS